MYTNLASLTKLSSTFLINFIDLVIKLAKLKKYERKKPL